MLGLCWQQGLNRKLRVFDRAGVLYSTSENCPGLGKTVGCYVSIIFDKTVFQTVCLWTSWIRIRTVIILSRSGFFHQQAKSLIKSCWRKELDPDPYIKCTDPRIRICTKMSLGSGTLEKTINFIGFGDWTAYMRTLFCCSHRVCIYVFFVPCW